MCVFIRFYIENNQGKAGVRFYTRAKTVTKHWYDQESRHKDVDTWEGTIERIKADAPLQAERDPLLFKQKRIALF